MDKGHEMDQLDLDLGQGLEAVVVVDLILSN
jgi:hypothetical protein